MRGLATVGVAVALLAGCGGGGSGAGKALSRTAANLGSIHSGTILFDLDVTPSGGASHVPFGFRVAGPFALARGGGLPTADVRYTQRASGKSATVELVSTGSSAFVSVGGKSYALPADRAAPLRSAGAALSGSGGGVRRFPLGKWFKDPKLTDGGSFGGAATDHIHAKLDAVRAIEDLGLAAGGRKLTNADADRLRGATKNATIDVWTGKRDRLLRRLVIDLKLGFGVPQSLRRVLGSAVGARMRVELAISHPNRAVHVRAPANARPYSALPHA